MRHTPATISASGKLRGIATLLIIGPAMLIFLVHGYAIWALTANIGARRRRLVRNVTRYSRFALKVMRVQVTSDGLEARAPQLSQLVVCNHMSYLDMMVLASLLPSLFVTSVDMGEVFFLGAIAEVGGSIFVERRHRDRLARDVKQLETALVQGFSVVLFPEGTSSDGTTVLPFRRSLLVAAANARRPILPVTLKYKTIDGEAFGPSNKDVVCWYGSTPFVAHFFRLLSAQSVNATVKFHRPVTMDAAELKHSVGDALYHTISTEYRSHGGESYGFNEHG